MNIYNLIFGPKKMPTLFSDPMGLAEPSEIKLQDSVPMNGLTKEQRASLFKIPKNNQPLTQDSEENVLYCEFLNNSPFYQPVDEKRFSLICEYYYGSLCKVQDLKTILADMRLYVQHSPECTLLQHPTLSAECSCGLIHLLDKYKSHTKG